MFRLTDAQLNSREAAGIDRDYDSPLTVETGANAVDRGKMGDHYLGSPGFLTLNRSRSNSTDFHVLTCTLRDSFRVRATF